MGKNTCVSCVAFNGDGALCNGGYVCVGSSQWCEKARAGEIEKACRPGAVIIIDKQASKERYLRIELYEGCGFKVGDVSEEEFEADKATEVHDG